MWADGEYVPSGVCSLGGGPAGAGGSGATGNTASVYTPTAQPQADTLFQNTLFNTFGPLAQNPSQTPAGQAYGQFTGSPSFLALSSPDAQSAGLNASGLASTDYIGNVFPGSQAAGNDLIQGGLNLGTAFNSNPFFQDPITAAQYAAAYGGPAANNAFNASTYLSNAAPNLIQEGANAGQDIIGQADPLRGIGAGLIGAGQQAGQRISAAADPLQGLSQALIQSGFDPQQALYNRLRQQTMNTATANNAFSGVGNTPYGQSVADEAGSNFDINWENQQLARQAQAAGAAQGVQGTIGSLLNTGLGANIAGSQAGAGIQGAIGNLLSKGMATRDLAAQTGSGLMSNALNLGQGATTLEAAAGALPSDTYMRQYGNLLSALGGAGNLVGQGANLGTQAAQGLSTFGSLPFNTASNFGQSLLGNLTGASNLGTSQYALPQQTIQDIESYLGLGQSASGISGQLGQLGQNQLMNSLSGFGSLAGLVGNPFSSSSSGLLGGAGAGLFGGGGDAGLAGFSGGGPAGLDIFGGAADTAATAGGGGLADALPALALS